MPPSSRVPWVALVYAQTTNPIPTVLLLFFGVCWKLSQLLYISRGTESVCGGGRPSPTKTFPLFRGTGSVKKNKKKNALFSRVPRLHKHVFFWAQQRNQDSSVVSPETDTRVGKWGERSCAVRSQLPALPWGKPRLWVLIPRHRRASLKYCCHAAITGSHWWYTNSPLAKLLKAH